MRSSTGEAVEVRDDGKRHDDCSLQAVSDRGEHREGEEKDISVNDEDGAAWASWEGRAVVYLLCYTWTC